MKYKTRQVQKTRDGIFWYVAMSDGITRKNRQFFSNLMNNDSSSEVIICYFVKIGRFNMHRTYVFLKILTNECSSDYL